MNIPLVDLKAQYETIRNEIDSAIAAVISGNAFVGGPFVKAFESDFAAFCGVKNCVGVGNGTDALFIALKTLGVGHGHEVIVPANSFIATSEAVTMAGARVVFADIEPQTCTLDVTRLEEKITSATKAIIPVHLYGHPADMDPVAAIAARYQLGIIEDAAQAHGAVYKGRNIGTLGDLACFSFYPGKNLGAYGDAGAIVTNDDDLAIRARKFANHGRAEKYNHEFEGVNSRLDGMQAAILSVKLKHLGDWTSMRRENARVYDQCLAGSPLVRPAEKSDCLAVYHLYVVRVQDGLRSELQHYLSQRHIATGIHYPIPLPDLDAYKYLNCDRQTYPRAIEASQQILSLPMYPELRVSHIQRIADKINSFYSTR